MSHNGDVSTATRSLTGNRTLSSAKKAKQDEFYTQYVDIQKEVEAYLEFDPDTFRGKVVYCNCDDPFESNFFKYFASNFKKLGLKKLMTTSYDGSPIAGQQALFEEYNEGNGKRKKPKALTVQLTEVKDWTGDGATGIEDVELFLTQNHHTRTALAEGGDFRSAECVALLKQADIVATNPPFSLFREYVAQLVEHGKKFLIIGSQNAITYREVFPLIKENKLWLGVDNGGTKWFQVQDDYDIKTESRKKTVNGIKYFSMGSIMWFTNLDHGRRHQDLRLMTMEDNRKFNAKVRKSPTCYQSYDNYDAIEVPFTDAIPSDYDGAMGVPITFLDKYNPDQFEIIGCDYDVKEGQLPKIVRPNWSGKLDRGYIAGQRIYARLLIRHRRPKGKNK